MNGMIYLAQVSACIGIFYVFYYLLLRKLTFFTINRWYLLSTLLLSFIIPLLKIKIEEPPHYVAIVKQVVYVIAQGQAINKPLQNAVIPYAVNWINLLRLFYFTITIALLVHLLVILTVFFARIKGKAVAKIGNIHILNTHKAQGNSSFLNFIFLNEDNRTHEELQQIIAHEMLHIKLYHSVDRIIVKIAQIIFWFNPFVYLYGREITANHEFEVDKKIISKTDRRVYANLLLTLAISRPGSLYNGFSNVPVARRIHMLFNKPSTNMKKTVYLLAVPVVLISCLAFAGITSKISAIVKRQQKKQEIIYRQKLNDAKQEAQRDSVNESMDAYRKTDDYKIKMDLLNQIMDKEVNVEIKDILRNKVTGKIHGFLIAYNKQELELGTFYGQEKQLIGQLKIGDSITLKVFGGSFAKDKRTGVTPAYVIKNGIKIFELVEAKPIPQYPFLYEANKVRFTNGQVTHIIKSGNGKWKSAVVETVNGYKYNLRFKENAPDFVDIEWGDHVTLRFVHEVKAGNKEFNVNEWVSISKNEKDYDFKNPDLFYKFYERG